MVDWSAAFSEGLAYEAFLDRYATPQQKSLWGASLKSLELSLNQRSLLKSFKREMKVLVMAGTWCGDCIEQCPMLQAFAAETPRIQLRFIDRDDAGPVAADLAVCGAPRVPAVIFLSEDDAPVGRYGDKTLAKFRALASNLADGSFCPTGVILDPAELRRAVVAEWLEQFERCQLILRTSSRLRQKHGD